MQIERARVDGLLRGAIGGLAGLVAMRLVFEAAGRLPSASEGAELAGAEPDEAQAEPEGPIEATDAPDDLAVARRKSRGDEPATGTLGRLAHEAVPGVEPADEQRQKLGHAVQWGYSVLVGGLYGAARTGARTPDVLAGLGYGTALWAVGDELMVPLLGLAEGPTAQGWTDHATALGAHLAYGAATSTATNALKRVM